MKTNKRQVQTLEFISTQRKVWAKGLRVCVAMVPLLVGASLHAQSLKNDLVAYWNFNGDLKDTAGGAVKFDGTQQGTDTTSTFVNSHLPSFGKALSLDGIDQFIEVSGGEPGDLSFEGGSMSVAGWFKVGTFDKSWQALIAQGEGSNWRVHRRGGESGFAHAGGTGEGPAGGPVNDEAWHHFVAISDKDAANFGTRLYIDGEVYTENANPANLANNGKRVKIGDNPDTGNRSWNGLLDDIAIWKRVITEDEIKILRSRPLSEALGVVLADADSDGMPDDFEKQYGFNPNDKADAALDFDKDGATNLDEYKAGTDPVDVTKPTIVSAVTGSNLKTIAITFSEELDPATATAAANYGISPALAVTGVTYAKKVATLTTADQTPGATAYTVTFAGVKDTSKNEVAAGTKVTVYSYLTGRTGMLRFAWWAVDLKMFPEDVAGSLNGANPIDTLLDHPRYISKTPNQVLPLFSFTSRDAFPTDAKDNYGATIEGLVKPTESGNYTFFIHSDDSSRLWLSTDDKEANLVQIAEETGCCGNFAEPGVTKTSDPIALVANRSYFIRLAYKEGGGGDYGRVAWRKDGDATPAASLVPIPGKFLSAAVDLPLDPDGKFGTISPAAKSKTAGPLPVITVVHTDGKTPWTAENVSLMFDGASVKPTVVKDGTTATITYTPGAVLPPKSAHTVKLTYPDPGGNPKALEWSFEVADYITLSTAIGTKPGSGKDAGFRIRTVQRETGRENSDRAAEQQLLDNMGDPNVADAGPNGGFFHHEGVINFNQDAPNAVGRFNAGNGFEDQPIPGISGGTDNFSQEVLTYLDLPAGVITMGVNSDDGFNVKPVTKADATVRPLGIFSGGRGAADTIFSFLVPVAGVYPMRMIWYEGGGGANAEWFTVNAGVRVLINSATAGAIKAFRSRDEAQTLPAGGGAITGLKAAASGVGKVKISFTGAGVIQSADKVEGPYTDTNIKSGDDVDAAGAAKFFRGKP